jgi:oligosaccharide repeat unit polymerase
MEIDFDIIPLLLSWVIPLFAIYYLLYTRFIYSVVDPLFVWVFTTSFASVLATQAIPETQDVLHFFGCQIALWFGFVIAYRQKKYTVVSVNSSERVYDFSDQVLLRWTTYLLLIVYIMSNIIIGYSKGFALLSNSPTESKIADFQEGFGLFRKINWSAGTFVSTSLIFMYFLRNKKIDLIFLIIVILFSSLEGSKSALLQVAVSVGIIFYHPLFSNRQILMKKFQRYLPLIFIGVMGVFFLVLMKENNGSNEAIFALIKRLLYSADSLLYFYTPINISYFDGYSFWDYISHNLTNPILGFFHLQPYKEALGNVMVDNLRLPGSTATVTIGPNLPFYIEGRIYFDFWGAFPYSMLVGYIYASIRIYFFSLSRVSAFYFVFMASFCHLASAIINDVNLAVVQLFNLAFFIIPSYIVISFFLTRKLTIRVTSKLHNV